MKKKVFSLMMTLVFAFMGLAQAQVYEVGDGSTTTNTALPTSSFYKNVLSQQIYTAEELGPAGNITSIAFYNGGTEKTRKIDVYMVLTDKEAFENGTDWIVPTAANKVYSDTALVFTANEWTTLTLTAPVAYDGTQNVAIIVHDYTGSYSSGLACRAFAGPSQALYVRSDGTQYNPLNPVVDPTATTPVYYTGTIMDVKNQVRFGGLQGPPMSVDLPTNSYYKFTLSQQLILPTDLDGIAELGSISFYNKGEVITRNLDVYMTLVDTTGFTGVFADSLDWVAVDSTDLVFSGEVTFARYDWTKIVFDTAFAYDGYSLVILTVDDNTDVAVEGLNFLMEEMDTTFAMYYHSDDSTRINPNPMTMAEPGVPTNLRNVMTFDSYMYELTVADSTATNGYVPVYGLYVDDYNKAEYIIPAEELASMGNASITGLKYYASQTDVNWGNASFQVFLKEVPETEISAFSGTTGATIVYEGSLSIVNGEMVIDFTTPYAYQGGNLLVGVYQPTEGTWQTSTWYGKVVSGASVQGYSSSSLNAVSPTQRNFIPKTTISYAPGLVPPVVIDPDMYILENSANLTPITTLDLGYRPNGAWMRPASWYLYNMTRHDATVRDYDFTPNPDFFDLVAPEVPFTLAADDSIQLSFTTADSIAAGVVNRQFAIMYDTRAAGVWDITATAYDPIENDVYELATELDMDDMPYVDTLFVMLNDTTRWLYDNYVLAPDTVEDGNDAVYKLTFDNDVLFNAYAYGENAKLALYAEDFNFAEYGIPGPDVENTYNGPVIGGGSTPGAGEYDVVMGDSTGTAGYYPFYTYFRNSISQQIYLASELDEAGVLPGVISQIGFQTYSTWDYTQDNVKIWMGNTNQNAFADPFQTVQTNNMILVYDGEFTPVVGWNMIDIEAAGFDWDGSSNIMIAVQSHAAQYHSGLNWVRTETSFESVVYDYNDNTEYDMTAGTYDIPSYRHGMYRSVTRFVSGTPNTRANVANAPRRNRDEATLIVNEEAEADNYYIPFYGLYSDEQGTTSECIIPAEDLADMEGGEISQMTFYLSTSASDAWTATWQVYLAEVDETTLSGVNGPTAGTVVFEGTLDATGEDLTIEFDEPYTYNGGNLLIGSYVLTAGTYKNAYFAGVSTSGATAYYDCGTSTGHGSQSFLPKVLFTYTPGGGDEPEPEPEPYVVNTVMDFSDGMIPADWTGECDYDEWYVDTVATGGQAAFNGMSLFMDGQANGEALYYATYNFEGQGAMTFNYIAKGGSTLDVVYGESTANLHTLASGLNSNTWKEFEVDLSELGETRGQYIIGFRSNGAAGGLVGLDNIFINLYGNPDAAIEDLTVVAGTYYLVVSSTEDSTFMVNICPREIPCPIAAANPTPADDADSIQPARVNLTWELGQYTTEYRLVFGTTYYCEETLVDWTSDLAQSYTVRNLFNNTNYFWRVDERNGGCETLGQVWGFTTHLNVPQNLRLEDESIFVGEPAVVIWDNIEDRTFRMYNIYVDGVYVGSTPETYNPSAFLSYVIDSLGYNMNPGYAIQVSALYDEGESALSEPVMAKVSGYGTFAGHVWEQDGHTGIANAEIIIAGYNEFGEAYVDSIHTNANGAYSTVVPVSTTTAPQSNISYTLMAHKDGYQGYQTPLQGYPLAIVYNTTTQADFILDEEFYPVGNVWAEYYPDPEEDDEYVKVYWTMSGNMSGGELTVCDGTSTSSYVPLYGLWVDDYTRTECVYPADMLAPLAGTQISSLKYYLSSPATGDFGAASFNVYLTEVPNTTISSYYGSDNATVVYSGSLDATGTEMMINFTTPYTYNGGNLLIGIEEPTTGTYHSAYFYGVESTGNSASGYNSGSLANVSFNQRNFLPKVTFNSGRSTAAADRSFHHYRIYRTSCYNDGPYNSDNTVMLASDWPTDTVYIDTNFDTVSPGVYKWGVSCIYQGNRSTDYPNPNDRESEIVWSNCLDKDMYLEPYLVDVNVILNSADSPEGTRVTFVNQNEIEQELYPVAPVILDESGFFAFESFRRGTYEVTVSKAGFESESEIVEIWGETHLRYVLTEIIYGVQNVYVSRTGWAMWEPMAPSGGGAGDLITFETGDFSEYSFDNGVSSYPWAVTNSQAYEGSYSMMSTNGGVASSASAIQATVNYSAPGTVEFAALCMGEGTSTYWDKCQFFIDGVEQFSCGANVAGWNEYSFDVASGSHTFKWSYTKDGSVNPTGDAMFVDNVRFTGGRSNDRHLEGYKVMCTSVDGVPIFTNNTIYPEPFCQLTTVDPNTGLAFLEEGEIYIVKVCAIYSTGQSDWTSAAFQYEPCDHWGPVDFVDVSTDVVGNYLEWSFENGYNPYDPGSGPTPGPGTNSFTDDFESGLGNWTLIDADGDGNNWYHSSQSMTYSCYDYTGWGHNTSDGFAVSQSYTDCTYDSYDPNNFMVTNQKYAIVAGSTLTFWADYGNDSYPDHFGVAVATADNPGASDFTMVWEGSAKGGNGKSAVRHNDNRYMNWRQHTVDLSAYAGQEVYIAFRHFNSYDQYEIYIDDVTLSAGAKGGETAYYGGNDLESGMLATGIYAFNVTDIENFDERVYTVANLLKDDRFEVVVDKNNSVLLVNTGKYHESEDLEANFNAFRAEMAEEFAAMDKETASETAMTLKSEMTYDMVNALMMDIYARSRENNLCSLADPFCTDNGMYEFPAGVNAGSGEPGPDYNCLYTQPNPAWYYMRIGEPGGIDIYMYSTPSVDIDFCCWGPFDDPVSPCPYGLTGDKVVSCSYSAAPTEHCMIPNNAQVGEYYILVITNYSNQTCNINFSAVGGAGSTDCGILPPVDIIGFLITMDGEYLDIVGPTVRDYTHYGEYGEHEYCVRPIYPGTMELPSDNFGWSMGCPVCGISGGEMHCEPGSPITGAYYYENGEDFGAILNWEGEIVPPIPVSGDEFTVDLDGGMPAGWTTIDADGDGYDWVLGSACGGIYLADGSSLAGAGHNSSADLIVSGSYSNVVGVGALTPDNFLVSPEVTLGNSSIFSFWACAQDAGYAAEHFGVAVSTDGINYDMVQEWTMTAKAGAKAGRGQNAQGTWRQYSVDLSAYAGEQAYIAIRHFNCTDMFMLDVDDIELSNGAKRNRAEIIAYNIYRSTDNIDYSLIGTVPAEEGVELYQYIDQTTPGTYYYQVTAVYSNGCESEGALNAENLDEDFVTVVVTGVEDNMGKVALYPNPTNGLVKIEARDMTHITVVSVVGQVVYDSNVSGDEFEINMAQWNAGVYVVRIATENGVSTQRVTVVK